APTVTAVNSIGSGDAMVAGFAVGLVENKSPEECLKLAMACGVSNTQFVEIGVVDKDNVEVQLDNIEIEILGS
ncbi:MAG TPA: PfkB family carbohydrate kinase, partial [Acetivibrio sp.]|nr:PfkB family carbohydrate kinase [Acetivibrio sp.]